MGLFSSIGHALSSVGRAICSGVSRICSGIGGALGIAAKAVTGFAEKALGLGQILMPKLPQMEIVILMVKVISVIAEVLHIKEPEKDHPEELALKAEEADKKPEDFNSTQEYIEYLQKEVKLDEKKTEKLSPEEKAAYSMVGSYLYTKAIAEKLSLDKDIDASLIMDIVKLNKDLGVKPEFFITVIRELKSKGITDANVIHDFLHNNVKDLKTTTNVEECFFKSFKETNSDMTGKEIYDKLADMENFLS